MDEKTMGGSMLNWTGAVFMVLVFIARNIPVGAIEMIWDSIVLYGGELPCTFACAA